MTHLSLEEVFQQCYTKQLSLAECTKLLLNNGCHGWNYCSIADKLDEIARKEKK